MPPLHDWQSLKCDSCGSPRFLLVFHLKYKPGGGTTTEPAGHVCQECHARVDVARLIDRANLEQKKAEIAALQAEVDAKPHPTLAESGKK